jgi:hypothetical protein
MTTKNSPLRFDASHCLVSRQLKLTDFHVSEAPDTLGEARLRHSTHLKGESDRGLWRAILGCLDHRSARKVRPVKVRRQRNDENRLERPRQRVALPDYDGASTGLFSRSIGTEIGRLDFAAFHRRSSRSSVSAHAPSPSSASFSSSAVAVLDRRARSQRAASGRRTTTIPTRSPGRSANRRIGRSTPSSNSASMVSMWQRIARAEQSLPPDAHRGARQ